MRACVSFILIQPRGCQGCELSTQGDGAQRHVSFSVCQRQFKPRVFALQTRYFYTAPPVDTCCKQTTNQPFISARNKLPQATQFKRRPTLLFLFRKTKTSPKSGVSFLVESGQATADQTRRRIDPYSHTHTKPNALRQEQHQKRGTPTTYHMGSSNTAVKSQPLSLSLAPANTTNTAPTTTFRVRYPLLPPARRHTRRFHDRTPLHTGTIVIWKRRTSFALSLCSLSNPSISSLFCTYCRASIVLSDFLRLCSLRDHG